jgi:hypothetical protein
MNILRGSGRTGGLGGGRRLRNIVVITEVVLSFVLLIGSGLMIRSFLALQRIDPGYDPHNVLTFQLFGSRGAQPNEEHEERTEGIFVFFVSSWLNYIVSWRRSL